MKLISGFSFMPLGFLGSVKVEDLILLLLIQQFAKPLEYFSS